MSQQDQAKIVEDILAAKTLYDVLGVSPNNLGSLRKAYLTTSVKVHPDKNQDPRATEAFQRVAEAWGTLSDEAARADYDAELRSGSRFGSSTKGSDNAQYAYDFDRTQMPSFADALFMFATATAMFSGGGEAASASRSGSAVNAASDFMETLFWAQKLAENRQKGDFDGDNQNASRSADPNNQSKSASAGAAEAAADNPLAAGMALGSGLRAFASAQRAMGMKKSAAATEKAATAAQVAAMGATVMKAANENPAVKRTLDRGSQAVKNNPQIAKGIRASMKMAGSIVMALAEAQKESNQQQQAAGQGAAGNRR